MEEKIKFIIIGLAGILVISIFINLQTYSAKKFVERERNELKTENETLAKKIDAAGKEIKQIQDKVNGLNSELDKITQEKDSLQKQQEQIRKDYELIVKEKDELKEKLKASPVAGGSTYTKEDAYWASVLKSKTDLSLQVDNLHNELKTLQINNEQLRKDLEGITREKDESEQQLSYNQKTFDNISSQLVLEKSTKFKIQDELKPIKSENVSLRRQLKKLISQKMNLESQLQQFKQDKSELQRRLDEIELFLQDRLARTRETELRSERDTSRSSTETGGAGVQRKESIELPPIVVRPQTETSGATPLQTEAPLVEERGTQVHTGGSVLGFNKENNFVVIDLGRNAGIKVGDTFQVYRGGKAIATIEVIQIRESLSACNIKEEIVSPEVGDTVR